MPAQNPLTITLTPAHEIENRIIIFQEKLSKKELDGALIIERINFYYYAGTAQQGWLYIPSSGRPTLMIFKEYSRAKAESPLTDIISLASSKKIPEILAEFGLPNPRRLGMELDILPVNIFHQYQHIFTQTEIEDISLEIRLQRAIKSEYELEMIRAAVRCSDTMATYAATILQEGKTELEASGEFESRCRSLGHQGLMQMRLFNHSIPLGHLMCGPSAAIPSYFASPNGGLGPNALIAHGAGNNRIKRNQPIIVDYAFGLNGYISDHTRIFSIGSPEDELVRGHEAMREIQEKAKQLCVPEAVTGEIYQQLIEMAAAQGYSDFFMGAGERPVRFIGHGLGLELDDFPFIAMNQKLQLQEGMVLALEPKLVFPGKGMVGIENTHIVTKEGLETLGTFPDEICII